VSVIEIEMNRIALITNVRDYAGEPSALAIAEAGFTVLGHSSSFESIERRSAFEAIHPGFVASEASSPEDLVEDAISRFGRIDAAISNDIHEPLTIDIDKATADQFRSALEDLVVSPFRLCSAVAGTMKAQGFGHIVLVTSGGPLRWPPHAQRPMYYPARSSANTLAKVLAVELAPHNIQVNAVAPFLLYSQTFFPSEIGSDDPQYSEFIRDRIPMGRFGKPEEIGELIAFLVSGKCDFVTGQVIAFSGGGA
jgi:NAD(P)-dependent dehydrogenase (short-subunit alcohol dehydrogenase family)